MIVNHRGIAFLESFKTVLKLVVQSHTSTFKFHAYNGAFWILVNVNKFFSISYYEILLFFYLHCICPLVSLVYFYS